MGRKPLKIAILSHYLPPVYSGAGKQALRIGTELQKNGHHIFFVSPVQPGCENRSEINGVKLYSVKITKISSYREHILFGIKALKILFQKRNDFDILFCPGMGALIGFLFFFMKIMKKKVVLRMSLFVDDPGSLKKRKLGPYLLLPYHLADIIIAPSTARLKGVTHVYPDKAQRLIRINNCVDINKFKPCESEKEKIKLKKKLSLETEQNYVSYVGRIIARKGVEFLIEAWKEVERQYNNATLLLIGPIDYKSKGEEEFVDPIVNRLKEEVKNNGMEDKVIFVGETDKVHEYLKISDVFIFASTAEGLPSAPIEAMAVGVPPVVLNIKDIMTDIITSEQDGIIVTGKNVSLFSESVIKLLSNEKYRNDIGNNARRKIIENFSIEAVGKKYTDLFYDI